MEPAHRISSFERRSVEGASGATMKDHHNTEVRLACAPNTGVTKVPTTGNANSTNERRATFIIHLGDEVYTVPTPNIAEPQDQSKALPEHMPYRP
jgi:hypothetical protein